MLSDRESVEGFDRHMAACVRLRDVIEALDLPNQDWRAYLNPDTGEIVTVTDEDRRLIEDGEEADLPAWQRESVTENSRSSRVGSVPCVAG